MDSINCLFHPHHASLIDHHRSLRSALLGLDEDPYYSIDGRSHRNVVAPKFDVCETGSAYFLEGDVPGLADKAGISVEWLVNRTLIVRGKFPSRDPLAEWGVAADEPDVAADEPADPKKHGKDGAGPRRWLSERRTGEFERSFTFSRAVDADGMKARLANGVLSIMVPKKAEGGENTRKIAVE
ncbi:hypothetical protein GP486_008749 [Trichoglossum hirsutum]|uniref:SHSP domain-containing protein n=1 Tax=Trichoglossum hirsutum TaxID=265104 RepID=A0A9P8I540_9PEZI|nr:hypothetical protein GP486_008749 [Trichoglossum hirsutum]